MEETLKTFSGGKCVGSLSFDLFTEADADAAGIVFETDHPLVWVKVVEGNVAARINMPLSHLHRMCDEIAKKSRPNPTP